MKKLVLLLLFTTTTFSQEPVIYWGSSMGSFAYDSAQAANIDPNDNLFLTGGFAATVDFDLGAGSYPLTSFGQAAGFLVKYNTNSQLQWGTRYSGDYATFGFGVDFDSAGNVYSMGSFNATVDFNPGAGVFNMSASTSPYVVSNIFMTKLNTAGNFIFAKQISSMMVKDPSGFTVDAAGNMYITGYFNEVTSFSPSVSLTPTNGVTNWNIYDIFIAKYTSNGDLAWVKQIGNGSISQRTEDISVDANGNILLCGQFHEVSDFDPSPTATHILSPVNVGVMDLFVMKLDSNGNFVWAKSMGGTASNSAKSMKLDASGNMYLTGYFSGTIDFDPGAGIQSLSVPTGSGFNGFVLKLDANGNFNWVKHLIGNSVGNALALHPNGKIVVTGQFFNSCDFSGAGTALRTTAGQGDAFMAEYATDGSLEWVKCFGGTQDDNGVAVTVDSSGNYFLFGDFYGTASMQAPDSLSLTSNGSQDAFIIKFGSALGNATFASAQFSVSPNPVHNELHIQFATGYEAGKIAIYTVDGRLVHTSEIRNVVDVAKLSPGIYILTITDSSGKSSQQKFIKK